MNEFEPHNKSEYDFFRLRQEGKIYITKVFQYSENSEVIRYVRIVFENSNDVAIGEVEGALCLRISPKKKNQVTAIVSQDDKGIRRITLNNFRARKNDEIESKPENSFTFRDDEFTRLLAFLNSIKFINFSNEAKFQIKDISTESGPKAIVDVRDIDFIRQLGQMGRDEKDQLLRALRENLTQDDINILLGRKQALETINQELGAGHWQEKDWQDFFEQESWIFGYGLDYRIMRSFDREMTVGSGGTDNRDKSTIDFLMTFTDYTALVEIKRPDTPIFEKSRNGRAGTWRFSSKFIEAVSQVLEQKAEWQILSQNPDLLNKAGDRKLEQRTRNAKTILVVGNKAEFERADNIRERDIQHDTFELFRRENRSIEIITFDELLERAKFIIKDS